MKTSLDMVLNGLVVLALAALLVMSIAKPSVGQVGVSIGVDPAPVANALSDVSRGLDSLSTSVNRGIQNMNNLPSTYQAPVRIYTPRSTAMAPPTSIARPLAAPPVMPIAPTTPTGPLPKLDQNDLEAIRAHQEAMAKARPGLGILPEDAIADLDDDQRTLQNMVQTEAFEAPLGEIIEWNFRGRTGSAQALTEQSFGSLICREFEQTLTGDGGTSRASATACRSHSGVWALAN